MSNQGFVGISRSVYRDPIFLSFSCEYRSILMTIIMNCAYEIIEMDDHGKKVFVQPGQLLTTVRELASWSFPPPENDKEAERHRGLVRRALVKFENMRISSQETSHRKSLITILRADILDHLVPRNIPSSSQVRPLNNNDNKDNNLNKVSKEYHHQRLETDDDFSSKTGKGPIKDLIEQGKLTHSQTEQILNLFSRERIEKKILQVRDSQKSVSAWFPFLKKCLENESETSVFDENQEYGRKLIEILKFPGVEFTEEPDIKTGAVGLCVTCLVGQSIPQVFAYKDPKFYEKLKERFKETQIRVPEPKKKKVIPMPTQNDQEGHLNASGRNES